MAVSVGYPLGMCVKYKVTLTPEEREFLLDLISAGKGAARRLAHARVLLKADEGPEGPGWPDREIAVATEVSCSTIERVRTLFVEEGLDDALNRRLPRIPKQRKLDGHQEAQLIAVACSEAPEGQKRWTLRLLADRMVELEFVDTLSYETVRRVLKKTSSNRG